MGLLEVVRVEHQQHVLLDGVPVLVGDALRGDQQLPGPVQPVQLEQAEPVGEQPVAVGEEEVEAAEGRALDRASRIASRSEPIGSPAS